MESYEEYLLYARTFTKKATTIKLTNTQKTIAAALAINVSDEDAVGQGEFGWNVYFKITDSQLKKNSKNLFGKALGVKNLRNNPSDDEIGAMDAYRRADGTPVVYYTDAETECDYAVRKTTVKKNADGSYTLTKKLYFGYWGNNDGKSSNYKVTYRVVKNSSSKYGYVIKSMTVKKI
jgi:hypothetical protein